MLAAARSITQVGNSTRTYARTTLLFSFYVPDMLHNSDNPESDSDYDHQPTTSGMVQCIRRHVPSRIGKAGSSGCCNVRRSGEATWQNDDDSVPNNDNSIVTMVTMVTMLFGAGATPNTKDDTCMTHYGLLRGVAMNFGLGSLGRNDTNTTNGYLRSFVH